MTQIITNTDLQRNIGKYSRELENTSYVVVARGKPKMVILPYFHDNDEYVQKYLEAYKEQKNKQTSACSK